MNRMDMRELPVGVFDSGVGGISVLRELVRIMPWEDYFFFGDSANAPYGTKSAERIRELTLARVDYMYRKGIKAIVVACNTATSAAIKPLREIYTTIPVIGIEPAVRPAVMVSEHPRVLVLATPGTVHGEKFQHLIHGFEEKADVTALPCPGLMEFVERGELDSPQLHQFLRELLGPSMKEHVDAVVLGCTHYPFVKKAIQTVVGENVPVLDGSEGTARETRRRLEVEGLLRDSSRTGRVEFEMSSPGKEELCRKLLWG